MTVDAELRIPGTNNAARIVVGEVTGLPTIGGGQLHLQTELAVRDPAAEGAQLWLRADVEVAGLRLSGRLGTATIDAGSGEPAALPAGGSRLCPFRLDLGRRVIVELDERYRKPSSGVNLHLTFHGYAWCQGAFSPVTAHTGRDLELTLSDWVRIADQVRLRRVILAEIDAPDAPSKPALAEALAQFQRAQAQLGVGEYRLCVEGLRKCLNRLVGLPADVEDTDQVVNEGLRTIRKDQATSAHPPRVELVRRALKFACDLGAHPETAETTRTDAIAALHMAAGLLHWYTQNDTLARTP